MNKNEESMKIKLVESLTFHFYELEGNLLFVSYNQIRGQKSITHNPKKMRWILENKWDYHLLDDIFFYYFCTGYKDYGWWAVVIYNERYGGFIAKAIDYVEIEEIYKDENGNDIQTKLNHDVYDVLDYKNIIKLNDKNWLIYTCGGYDEHRKVTYIREHLWKK